MTKRGRSKTIQMELPADLGRRLQRYARANGRSLDEAAQSLLQEAIDHKQRCQALARFRRGQLTIRELAERLKLSYYEVNDLLVEEGIALVR